MPVCLKAQRRATVVVSGAANVRIPKTQMISTFRECQNRVGSGGRIAYIENRYASAPQPAQNLARGPQVEIATLYNFSGNRKRAGLEFFQPIHQRETGVLGSV